MSVRNVLVCLPELAEWNGSGTEWIRVSPSVNPIPTGWHKHIVLDLINFQTVPSNATKQNKQQTNKKGLICIKQKLQTDVTMATLSSDIASRDTAPTISNRKTDDNRI